MRLVDITMCEHGIYMTRDSEVTDLVRDAKALESFARRRASRK